MSNGNTLPTFGWLDDLVDIHFPKRKTGVDQSEPWFYYLTLQTPTYFQFIGDQLGGHGWQCAPFLPVIRILPIDSQKMTPTKQVGFGSLEEAINRTNEGHKIGVDAWGRFNFKNKFFWDVMGQPPPTWMSFAKGLPTTRVGDGHRPARLFIKEAVTDWDEKWNSEAGSFNALCNNVKGSGEYGKYGTGPFALPVPGFGHDTINLGSYDPQKYYFGAVPPFVTFERGSALIFKQSFSFKYAIAQLDATVWDMSVFPPRNTTLLPGQPGFREVGGVDRGPSSLTHNFGGYGPINFPLTPPIIAGTHFDDPFQT